MEPAHWTVGLFGGLNLHRGSTEIVRFRTRKTGLLLAYLAYYRKREHVRESLIDLLWPETDLGAGRVSLRVALSSLRALLEPDSLGAILRADRTVVSLAPDSVETDVERYETTLDRARHAPGRESRILLLEEAIGIYAGDLLPGFYEDWVQEQRERLHAVHVEALKRLTGDLLAAGRPADAVKYGGQLLERSSMEEPAYLLQMRGFAMLGSQDDVTRVFRRLERMLAEEFEEHPSEELKTLYGQLRSQARTSARVASPGVSPGDRAGPSAPAPPPIDLPQEERAGTLLPLTLTPLFGREEELQVLADDILSSARLITLTGPGGSGKTRLSIEVGRRLRSRFAGQVHFVSLVEARPEQFGSTLSSAFVPGGSTTSDPLEGVIGMLSKRPSLLILDNLEHIVPGAAAGVRELLERCPDLVCLATSRQNLGLGGERVFAVHPLGVPLSGNDLDLVRNCASVQLFLLVVQAHQPETDLTPRNAQVIVDICRRLDGLPLALELAGGAASSMSLPQILTGLSRRLDFARSRRRDTPDRHRSLRAAIEWSFNLLSPDEQRFLLAMGVFEGSWSLPAAQEISLQSDDAPDYLADLRERSFLSARPVDDEMRFRMLETTREFVREQVSPSEREELARRHAEYFLHIAEETESQMWKPDEVEWLNRLDRDRANIRAAIEHALVHDSVRALKATVALTRYWDARGNIRDARTLVDRALAGASAGVDPRLRGAALHVAATMAFRDGDSEAAVAFSKESVAILRQLGHRRQLSRTLSLLASAYVRLDRYEAARESYEESLALRRELGDPNDVAIALHNLALVESAYGHEALARQMIEEALVMYGEESANPAVPTLLMNLGNVLANLGERGLSRKRYDKAIAIARQRRDNRVIGNATRGIALLDYYGGRLDSARKHCDASLRVFQERSEASGCASSLLLSGQIHTDHGDFGAARRDCGESLRFFAENRFCKDACGGLRAFAHLCIQERDLRRAAQLLGADDALRGSMRLPVPGLAVHIQQKDIQAIRAALEEGEFDQEWSIGRSLNLDRAVAIALESPGPSVP